MLYQDPIHQPFSLDPPGRVADTAAMLIHGYMGSPAELRALGAALAGAGIRADAPALPGFGPDIARLAEVDEKDWVSAAKAAWETVSGAAATSVLIGFSMGGAVALAVAAGLAPARLILIEPFQRIPDWRARFLPFVGPVLKEIKLFKDADLADPATRASLDLSARGLDLDDPETQRVIREEATMPISSLQALARLGTAGLAAAPRVACPTLIIQASPYTAEAFGRPEGLSEAMGTTPRVAWVDGDHQLVRDDRASWPEVRDLVVAFASGSEVTS